MREYDERMEYTELPETSKILSSYPYDPLQIPAENIAERLIILGHLCYNRDVWAISPERRKRYWLAYTENVRGGANTNKLNIWWSQVSEGMAFLPLGNDLYLHEKNLLLSPESLSIPVGQPEVLQVFRQQTDYLVDRVRMWVKAKNNGKKAVSE